MGTIRLNIHLLIMQMRGKAILDFVCQYFYLVKYCNKLSTKFEKNFLLFFHDNKKYYSNDILAKEKWFIIGLLRKLNSYPEVVKKAFEGADDYFSAQYMLSGNRLLNNSDLKKYAIPVINIVCCKISFDYE